MTYTHTLQQQYIILWVSLVQSDPRLLHMHTSQQEYNAWKQCVRCFLIGIHCNIQHFTLQHHLVLLPGWQESASSSDLVSTITITPSMKKCEPISPQRILLRLVICNCHLWCSCPYPRWLPYSPVDGYRHTSPPTK